MASDEAFAREIARVGTPRGNNRREAAQAQAQLDKDAQLAARFARMGSAALNEEEVAEVLVDVDADAEMARKLQEQLRLEEENKEEESISSVGKNYLFLPNNPKLPKAPGYEKMKTGVVNELRLFWQK